MAFTRDMDDAGHAVGAIAARDVGNRKRQLLRSRQAKMTQARDRRMSRIGYSDRGGMGPGAIGAVDMAVAEGLTDRDMTAGRMAPTKLYGGAGSLPLPAKATMTMSPPFVDPGLTVRTAPAYPEVSGPTALPVADPTTSFLVANKKILVIGALGIAAYLMLRDGA